MTHAVLVALLLLLPLTAVGAQTQTLFAQVESTSPEVLTWPVTVPPFGVEHQVRLALEARIDWPQLSGSNPWLTVSVNGNRLGREDLLNKPDGFTLRNGVDLTWYKDGRWRVLYSPDFEAALTDKASPYGPASEQDQPYRFVWDITRHVRPGANEIRVEHHKVLQNPDKLVLRNVALEVGKALEAPRSDVVEPAPTGPLPTLVARVPQAPKLTVQSGGGTIRVGLGGQTIRVRTRLSLPGGAWREAEASGGDTWVAGPCRVSRSVKVSGDHVSVADTLTNTSDDLIGVRFEHCADLLGPPEAVYLAGRKTFSDSGNQWEPAHPSAFAQFQKLGVGLVAEDDVFRVQVRSLYSPEGFGLADDRLGLAPRSSVTLEWAIYPAVGADYWAFVNAVRRNWGVNYTVPGAFVFKSGYTKDVQGAQWAQWMHDRGLTYMCGGIAQYANGLYAHGTGILAAPEFVARERAWSTTMYAADPSLVPVAYFHAQCCTEADCRTKYADSRLLDATGKQVDYPHAQTLPLFVPTEHDSYGQALWKYLDCLIKDVKARGIYWDEMSYSVQQYCYGLEWDGHSVNIDPRTNAVTGKFSSVALIMQPLALKIVDYIRGQGLFFMANTQAHTRTMMRKHLVRFVEGNTFSAMTDTHLGCPLGLGNHTSEETQEESARHVREHLKRGALYYGHYYFRKAAPWNFTAVMFPITPEQIGPGYVLGKERLHTAVSGRFGFPDGAAAEVYVVNAHGERVTGMAQDVGTAGKHLYEIRMPGDHFAILVRKV